jgi:hypothetical protein
MTEHQQGARCAEDLEALAPGCVPRTDHAATRAPSSRTHISPSELPLEVANGCGLGGNLGAKAPMMSAAETRVAEGWTRQATPHSLARIVRLGPPRGRQGLAECRHVTIIRHKRVADEAAAISRAAHNRLESRRSSKAASERDRARGARVTGVSTRVP